MRLIWLQEVAAGMKNAFETGNPAVDRMSRLQITGNVIPVAWFKTIRKATGKPNLNAIIILADIVYWYRPVEVRDEATGQLIGLRKRFSADLLQRNYQQMSEQFGISKRDTTNAIVELEKLGVIRRVFRTIEKGGHLVSNVLFLDLDVDVLEKLTYPENYEKMEQGGEYRGCPRFGGEVSPKPVGGITQMRERVPLKTEGGVPEICETNTENNYRDYNRDYHILSFPEAEEEIRVQIDYDALKFDAPYDERIDEILGIMVDVMTSTAQEIRVNKENKPAAVVKSQFSKLRKQHIEYVLRCMDEAETKARNIRAVLITALYNSVHTISSYYGNLYQYHQSQYGSDEEYGEEMDRGD